MSWAGVGLEGFVWHANAASETPNSSNRILTMGVLIATKVYIFFVFQ